MKDVIVMAVAFLAGAVFLFAVGCENEARTRQAVPVQYGPPTDAPTLDYESVVGFDPLTSKTIEERERNNELSWRVDRLERQVRDLNQKVYGIRELRIGEGPPKCENPDCDCDDCDCDECKCTPENPETQNEIPISYRSTTPHRFGAVG